jgi:hypothetical protein
MIDYKNSKVTHSNLLEDVITAALFIICICFFVAIYFLLAV